MVRAEFTHNPYLLKTEVKFNGRVPKINSLVKNYEKTRLQDWLAGLPDIFNNEMNGWSFALDFSGTKVDFECLQKAFANFSVDSQSVCLFHKNELESVSQKEQEILTLLSWLENNPNRKFDYISFRENKSYLFDEIHSIVIVGTIFPLIALQGVNVETVSDMNELDKTVLENTPVLFGIDENNYTQLRNSLNILPNRDDVSSSQIFFYIAPTLNRQQVERTIKDLGFSQPQIIESTDYGKVISYLEIYPRTVYIQRVISVMREVIADVNTVLQNENEQSIGINSGIRQQISKLDDIIQKLKYASEQIVQRDNLEPPVGLSVAKADFIRKIANWQKKKIKMTSDDEARKVAAEFEKDTRLFFKEFISQTEAVFHTAINDINSNFLSIYCSAYCSADFGDTYEANQEFHIDLSGYASPELLSGFLELRSEAYAEQSETPLGLLKNIWSSAPPDKKELVKVVTYLYQEWRENAAALNSPVLDGVIQSVNEALKNFYERTAQEYIGRLKALIQQQTQLKDEVSSHLSDEERALQADNDWFFAFQEKLREIERG